MTPRRTTLLRAAAVTGASAVLVAAGFVIADETSPPEPAPVAATDAADPTEGTDGDGRTGLSSDALPQELIDDVTALLDLPADERAAALADLRARAAAGDYGDVAARAEAGLPDLADLLGGLQLPDVDLGGLQLPDVDLDGVQLPDVDLGDVDLGDVDLGDLGRVDLGRVDLGDVDLGSSLGSLAEGWGG